MTVLSLLGATDIRDQLPRADWRIGTRNATTSLTWHYNGPAVAPDHQAGAGLIAQLKGDAEWQMRKGWGGTVNGAPHLMYHLVIGRDGAMYQTADLYEQLWHCAHQDGNSRGLALHFPLGEGQAPSTAQMAAGFRASDLLRAQFNIPLNRVLGHLEWKHATACPGSILMRYLESYRTGVRPTVAPTPIPAELRRFEVTSTANANVRQGPGTSFPVAGRMKPGTILFVDAVKVGEAVDGNHLWVHMARVPNEQADLGFVSATLGRWI